MTKAQIFKTVRDHLLTQNCKSYSEGTTRMCAYRGNNGTKCAIGILIKDKDYNSDMEGKPVANIVYRFPHLGYDINLLSRLQRIHDDYEPKEWAEQLDIAARVYNIALDT